MTAYESVRAAVLAAARRLGFQIQRICPTHSDEIALRELLRAYQVDLVLDVGANVGQFAAGLIESGWPGRIVSYEPLAREYAELERVSAHRPQWTLAERCCIGDHDGEVEVQVSENSVASSILPLASSMDAYSPSSRYVATERVPMTTLDIAAEKLLLESRRPFLKVDVQGYEDSVLRGAPRTLARLVGVQIELSFIELYEGQMLFSPFVSWLDREGFVVHRMVPSFVDTQTGRWLQADVIAFRPQARQLAAS